MDLQRLQAHFAVHEKTFIEDWKRLLRFESISTDPSYSQICEHCAHWLVDHLARIGLASELLKTCGKPVVFAEYIVPGARKTVVFYGHYDVQPVDPLERWQSKPFEPEVREGRLYARGAQDNKGQLFYFIKALEFLIQEKALSVNVKVFIEGEEEHGSAGIVEAMPGWKERAKGDVLMVCDTGTIDSSIATITMGLRGILSLSIELTGPKKDLHSGVHGGVVKNPAAEMARLVASLHNDDGSVAVDGFYDGVAEIDPEDAELSNQPPLDPKDYETLIGVLPLGGEQRFTPMERSGFRPTVEINGIHSGYGGPGAKTVIPSSASAKITSRLIAGQDPKITLERIIAHLKKKTPDGVTLTVSDETIGGGALRLSSKSPLIVEARAVLNEIFGQEPIFRWLGASVPIVAGLAEVSGAEPLLIGFGLEEDNIHSPNESFMLDQFRKGFLYCGLILSRL